MPYQSEDHFMSRKHVWSVPLTTENLGMHHLEIEALPVLQNAIYIG